MKRTCFTCRALDGNLFDGYFCDLHYPIDNKITKMFGHNPVPLKSCPKPKTYKELIEEYRIKEQNNV